MRSAEFASRIGRAILAAATVAATPADTFGESGRAVVPIPGRTREMTFDPSSGSLLVRTLHDVYRIETSGGEPEAVLLTPPVGPDWSIDPKGSISGTFRLVPGETDAAILVPAPLGQHVALFSPTGGLFGVTRERRRFTRLESIRTLHLGPNKRPIVTGTPIENFEGGGGRWMWQFWDPNGKELIHTFTAEPARIAIAPAGSVVAIASGTEIRLFSASGEGRGAITGRFRHLSLSRRGRIALSPADRVREVVVRDPSGKEAVYATGAPVHGVRISPDGAWLMAWHRNGRISRVEMADAGISTWVPDLRGSVFVTSAEIRDDGRILLGFRRRAPDREDWDEAYVAILDPGGCARLVHLGSSPFDSTTPEVLSIDRERLAIRTTGAVALIRQDVAPRPDHGRAACVLDVFLDSAPPKHLESTIQSSMTTMHSPDSSCGTWPLSPMDEDHAVAGTLEFQDYDGQKIHPGLDIPAVPDHDDSGSRADAQFAMVRRGGYITGLKQDDPGKENGIIVRTTDGVSHVYHHLARGTFNPDIVDAYDEKTSVPAGTWIAKIANWDEVGSSCGSGLVFHHLHYAVASLDGETFYNPLSDLVPFQDKQVPDLTSLRICDDDSGYASTTDPWQNCVSVGTLACSSFSKTADAVVQVRDHHMAGVPAAAAPFGGARIGVRKLRFRLCPESNPVCDWTQEHVMDSTPRSIAIPADGPAAVLYSIRQPMKSDSEYCDEDVFWMIPTNVVDGGHSRVGAIDPSALSESFYSLAVEAEDFFGNVGSVSATLCPAAAACKGKLVIRDCVGDIGAEPSGCPGATASPDIFYVPTAAADLYSVQACVRNAGCGSIEPGETVTVTATLRDGPTTLLAWPPIPVAARSLIPFVPSTAVADAPWQPGHSRCYAGMLSTSGIAIPASPARLVVEVKVEMAGDAANTRSDVLDDNNRAAISIP